MNTLTLKMVIAAAGTAITAFVGGWDKAMTFLAYAMAADYVTGVLAAWKGKRLDSNIMFWGGIRKFVIVAIVGLCLQLDHMLGYSEPVLRTYAIYYYIAREALSFMENTTLLGAPWPDSIKQRLIQFTNAAMGSNKE